MKTLKKRFKSHLTVSGTKNSTSRNVTLLENEISQNLKGGDSSTIYRYLRNFTRSNDIPQTIYFSNVCATTDLEKASLFNKYFHSVYSSVHCDLSSSFDFPQASQMLEDISIKESEAYQLLISLNTSKAMGCDGISSMLLKHCVTALFQPLHHLFLLSIMQSYLLLERRTHLIKPILKSGSNFLVENYRPISLLCIAAKILEKIIHNKISGYMINYISDSQSGFLKNQYTLQQLLIFFNLLTKKSSVDVIYLDFKKAFDSVSHVKLLEKLWAFGITDNV